MNCTLCHGADCRPFRTALKPHDYFHCPRCDLRFLDPALQLSPEAEKARYLFHQNDVENEGYRRFLEPVYFELKKRLAPDAEILDFGAGPAPVVIHRLKESGYSRTAVYDPNFWPDKDVLGTRYDAIFASEVIEHLRRPSEEFARLRESLSPQGIWLFMTLFYDESTDFNSWYYRQDPTHICFYSKKTMEWLRDHFGFSKLEFPSERVSVLS